jgi:hypothetical protein
LEASFCSTSLSFMIHEFLVSIPTG